MDNNNILEIRGLKSYFFTEKGTAPAVDGVDIDIPKGQIVGLVGESGCGKSMTVRSVMGLLKYPGRVVGGSILFDGEEIAGLPENKLRDICGRDISMIFQEPMTSLNPVVKVGKQVRGGPRQPAPPRGSAAGPRPAPRRKGPPPPVPGAPGPRPAG